MKAKNCNCRTAIAFLLFIAVSTAALRASADITSPVGISFITLNDNLYLQFPGTDDNVYGVRVGIISSRHKNVGGFDFGVIMNTTKGEFTGVEIAGAVNRVAGRARVLGLQFAGLMNIDRQADIFGLQLAGLSNWVKDNGAIVGGQISLVYNKAPKLDIYGLQLGLINEANNVYGLQLGLFNIAKRLHGIQIGLINVNKDGFPKFFPGVNIGI